MSGCGATSPLPAEPTPPACSYAIAPEQLTQGAASAGGEVIVTVLTSANCAVTASTASPFITIGDQTRQGDAVLQKLMVAPNAGTERVGTATISALTVTIRQAAKPPCGFRVSPEVLNIGAAGGPATVNVNRTDGTDCSWTATSANPFLTIVEGASGTEDGVVKVMLAENTGSERTANLLVAGRAVRVIQSAAPGPPPACAFTVSPLAPAVDARAQTLTVTVAVTSGANCSWTSTSNAPFLTVTSSAAAIGSGSVSIAVAANGGAARSGTLTIAGRTVSVSQAAPPSCVTGLSLSNASFVATGGTATATVAASADCAWATTADAGFVTVPAGARTGPGTFDVVVAANPSPNARSGRVFVGDSSVFLQQSGAISPPAPPAGATTYFSIIGQPGDYIVGATSRVDVRANAAFSATVDAARSTVTINVEPADSTNWSIVLAAKQGSQLVPGTYELARRFSSATNPGLDFTGNGRGCNQTTGGFVVHEAQFSGANTVERFRVTFEQHCEGGTAAAFGDISLVAPFGPAPPGPPPPPAPPSPTPATTTFSYVSDAGDYIGGGQTATYTVANAAFSAITSNAARHLTVSVNLGFPSSWTLSFDAPIGQRLVAGVYAGATRYPFQSAVAPGLDFSGMGRGCNQLTGQFVIYEIQYGPGDTIERLRATFEQHCEGAVPALRGDVTIIGNPPR